MAMPSLQDILNQIAIPYMIQGAFLNQQRGLGQQANTQANADFSRQLAAAGQAGTENRQMLRGVNSRMGQVGVGFGQQAAGVDRDMRAQGVKPGAVGGAAAQQQQYMAANQGINSRYFGAQHQNQNALFRDFRRQGRLVNQAGAAAVQTSWADQMAQMLRDRMAQEAQAKAEYRWMR